MSHIHALHHEVNLYMCICVNGLRRSVTLAGLVEGVIYIIRYTTQHELLQDNGTTGTGT